MAEAGKVVLAVGIDDRERVGQPLGRLVVVEYDHVEAELSASRDRLVADRAAVDGDDEARAAARRRRPSPRRSGRRPSMTRSGMWTIVSQPQASRYSLSSAALAAPSTS